MDGVELDSCPSRVGYLLTQAYEDGQCWPMVEQRAWIGGLLTQAYEDGRRDEVAEWIAAGQDMSNVEIITWDEAVERYGK